MRVDGNLEYDLVVIGSGPAGEKAAMQASKLKKKALLIEKSSHFGGASLHTGTIPSKTLRETIRTLDYLKKGTQGIDLSLRQDIETKELMVRKDAVIREQENSLLNNLNKNNIDHVQGETNLLSPNLLEIKSPLFHQPMQVKTKYIVIATGSRPHRVDWAPYDQEYIFDSDSILNIKKLPEKITIIGAGVIGCEYACIFARLGIRVNLIAHDKEILPFLDREISQALMYSFRNHRIALKLGEEVIEAKKIPDFHGVNVYLKSGKVVPSTAVLVASGRDCNIEGLGHEEVGVQLGKRGQIVVNEHYQTSVENIYAVGDVVGFPSLASTAMIQARISVLHAFGRLGSEKMPTDLPYGIWTFPAVAMVGKTEEQLTETQIPYEIGIAHFKEVVQAHIIGEEEDGILKLLFDPVSLKLLGVHIIGPRAPEIIHLGQAVMYHQGDIKYFANAVFNYPTLDEAYRIAAFNGLNRLNFDL